MDPQKLLETNLKHIEDIIKSVCWRNNLDRDAAEDFSSHVKLQLIENNYDRIRKFQGKSSFKTYLTVVINRLFIDQLIKKEKRWRPSESSKQIGEVAVKLEELLYRRNMSFDEAYETLTTNHGLSIKRDEAYELAHKLKPKTPALSLNVGDELLASLAHPGNRPNEEFVSNRALETGAKLYSIIDEIKSSLSDEDRLILKMRFEDEFSVSDIARVLNINRSVLDRRIKFILNTFKEGILSRGMNINDVTDVMEEIEKLER